ncbi:MAG: hypothetical protein KDJ80_09085 [Nitratireductor sp.]|nr:hypothetical protein [Nitratireductor sp.]
MGQGTVKSQHPAARKAIAAALAACALLAAGCAQKAKNDPLAGGGGLTGRWVSSDNVFTAEFRDGAFSSVANDTGETLSTGNYIVVSTTEIKLDWYGTLSRQQNSATCQRPAVDQLNCADGAGRRFSLRKIG